MQRRSTDIVCVALLAIGIVSLNIASVHADDFDEYRVKGAFLYNFLKYVDWSDQDLVQTDGTLIIAIAGDDPFGPELDGALHGRRVDGHGVRVVRIQQFDSLPPCHLLFTATDDPSELARILQSVDGQHVLTVGESQAFLSLGGMVRLMVQDGRVRFDVNLASVHRRQISISATLLNLAHTVINEEDQ